MPKANWVRRRFTVKPVRGRLFIAKLGSKASGGEELLYQTKTSARNVSNTKVTLYPMVKDRTEITADLGEKGCRGMFEGSNNVSDKGIN